LPQQMHGDKGRSLNRRASGRATVTTKSRARNRLPPAYLKAPVETTRDIQDADQV
jgi:hypothetical protein